MKSSSEDQSQGEEFVLIEENRASVEVRKPPKERYRYDAMTELQVYGYGVGHFINDVLSSKYLLYYFTSVIGFRQGPSALLAGQLTNAFVTPTIGHLSDKTETSIGKRKPWYIGGVFITITSSMLIWSGCLPCHFGDDASQQYNIETIYYVLLPVVFNLGWAAVQIAHMSLVPSLSCGRSRRDRLNSLRNTTTFMANVFIQIIAAVCFQFIPNQKVEFFVINLICTIAGLFTTVFFVATIKENFLVSECVKIARELELIILNRKKQPIKPIEIQGYKKRQESIVELSTSNNMLSQRFSDYRTSNPVTKSKNLMKSPECNPIEESQPDLFNQVFQEANSNLEAQSVNRGTLADEVSSWKFINYLIKRDWFKQFQFYRFCLVYSCVRLFSTCTQTFIVFYLQYVLEFKSGSADSEKTPIQLALVPLMISIFGALTSPVLPKVYRKIGKKWALTIGTWLWLGIAVALATLTPELKALIYPLAPVMGVSLAIALNAGVTLISEVIGLKGSSGAFVFGVYSFANQISAGLSMFFLTNSDIFKDQNSDYIRQVIVIIPTCCIFSAWLMIVIPMTYNERHPQEVERQSFRQSLLGRRTKSISDEFAV